MNIRVELVEVSGQGEIWVVVGNDILDVVVVVEGADDQLEGEIEK
jgi:hypothetical protein